MTRGELSFTQFSAILLVCMMGFAHSDFAQDRTECANQLVSLATCLTYMQGKAKAPTTDCCNGLKQLVDKSKRCLCILVKDRDDPQLDFKFNATVALGLPRACSTSVNATECIDILHLSPNAPEAQVFKQIPSGDPPGSSSANHTGSSSRAASNASGASEGGKRLTEMFFDASAWFVVSIMVLCG